MQKEILMEAERAIIESKEFRSAEKKWGQQAVLELIKKTDEEAKQAVILNSMHINEVTEQVKANPKYVEAMKTKKAFDGAIKDKISDTVLSNKLFIRVLSERKKAAKEAQKQE